MHTHLLTMSTLALLVGCGPTDFDKNDDVDIYSAGEDGGDGGSDDGGSDDGGGDDGGSDDGGSDDGGSDDGGSDDGGDDGGTPGGGPVDSVGLPPCSSVDGHATTIDYVAPETDGMLELQLSYGGGCEEQQCGGGAEGAGRQDPGPT